MTNRAITNQVNKLLSGVVNGKYLNEIPLDEIFQIIRDNVGEVLDVDNTPLGGVILCGDNGSVHFIIRDFPNCLHIGWYTMPSGRYEVLAYVS